MKDKLQIAQNKIVRFILNLHHRKSVTYIDTTTNLSNSYSNDMLTVKLSGFPNMHWRDLFTSTRRQVAHYYLLFKHFLQKGPCNSTQFKNS